MAIDNTQLNERAQQLLKVLIEGYIVDGAPVGSSTLAKRSGLKISPATVRNVMALLEDQGYIHAPHTSAGRIPTARGYRLFVDSLVNVQELDQSDLHTMQGRFSDTQTTNSELIQTASSLLSNITQLAGVITLPSLEAVAIRHIEFLYLSTDQILVVLVMSDNEVQNRIIHTDQEYSSEELQQYGNYLNQHLNGMDLHRARQHMLDAMNKDRETLNKMMLSAIELGEKAFDDISKGENSEDSCLIVGKTNLLDYDDFSDMDTLRQIFNAFNEKRDVLKLLDNCIQAKGVQIFIGRESGKAVFDDCSLVTAPYSIDDKHLGVLGVIGPKRMQYEKVIPVVDITSRLLSAALRSKIA
ncbi:heat-inducible transcriptional repressor HrcA [Leucothrix pacifica]|uniref:Heat-inducible transcription repressor HrcA n=1 Tax=Leucothrix pacifica TaxID=1247513 RepID=A0A317CII7_9GAMM|nr:heat-inducible transcriptional repressor HrcA [Leucothrix pacifica]PWQ97233.1 heat-inducible transcription repressor HrcA [Leucothrix pacifica]